MNAYTPPERGTSLIPRIPRIPRRAQRAQGALETLAEKAYVYGYPLVYNINQVTRFISGPGLVGAAPVNVFGHSDKLAGPEDEFVSINNDNLYSILQADVTQEPLVLHVPNTNDRYYVMQHIDAWTNNFAYIGRRATGTREGLILLAGPGWDGEAPDGVTLVRVPTNVFTIVGRFAVNGEADISVVRALQDETWVTPLSRFPEPPDNSGRDFGDWPIAGWDENVAEDLKFWEQMRAWMKLFPPSVAEQEYIQKFEPLGLLADESPYVNPDPALAEALKAGEEAGKAKIEAKLKIGQLAGGWQMAMHLFDYNLDYLELGTIDSPEWKIRPRSLAHLVRAIAARVGLWGNHGYEALYAQIFVDDRGEQLDGAYRYVLHFNELPPVDAFWSVTMYNVTDFYLVPNPINRYSIGDRTPGLRYNDDGSLDIYIQRNPPGAGKAPNWLPAPKGDFRLIMRMYQPQQELLNRDYVLPPIRRVKGMDCFTTILLLLSLRMMILIWWLFQPPRFIATFTDFIWSMLGLAFLPWTTLMYYIVWSPVTGIADFDWVWLGIAFVVDIGMHAGSAYSCRNYIPVRVK